ncbi:MAG: hypothetical protein JJE22_18430, partial [Bacteroidia bacterium]|nr:hypothetical protein [Bacteroidia bacterium]
MKLKYISGLLLVAILLSCSSSQITSSWKASSATPKKFNKVLVVGLIGENDKSLREKMEQHLVGDLLEAGYDAVSSFKEYGPKAFENM